MSKKTYFIFGIDTIIKKIIFKEIFMTIFFYTSNSENIFFIL